MVPRNTRKTTISVRVWWFNEENVRLTFIGVTGMIINSTECARVGLAVCDIFADRKQARTAVVAAKKAWLQLEPGLSCLAAAVFSIARKAFGSATIYKRNDGCSCDATKEPQDNCG